MQKAIESAGEPSRYIATEEQREEVADDKPNASTRTERRAARIVAGRRVESGQADGEAD